MSGQMSPNAKKSLQERCNVHGYYALESFLTSLQNCEIIADLRAFSRHSDSKEAATAPLKIFDQ